MVLVYAAALLSVYYNSNYSSIITIIIRLFSTLVAPFEPSPPAFGWPFPRIKIVLSN